MLWQATKRPLAGRSKPCPVPQPGAHEDSGLAGSVNTLSGAPIKKWLPEACNADFLLAQETDLPKNALAAEESWMRSEGWRAASCLRSCITAAWRVGGQRADGSQHGLSTPFGGASSFCKERVPVLNRSGIVQGGALLLSVSMRTGARLTQENWQVLSMAGQCLTSQALPFVVGGDFQVEPKQLEDSVGGFVVAPQLATVTPSRRVVDFFVSRDLATACKATPQISGHIAHHRPVRFVVSTRLFQPRKLVMNRPNPWPTVGPSGCKRLERDPDCAPVRRSVFRRPRERKQCGRPSVMRRRGSSWALS